MDFSHLRELASVYLSETIQNHQVLNFQKPVIKINYNSGIMECFMEDTEYDEEELFKLYQGMKLVHSLSHFIIFNLNNTVILK